jgi:hypothetical protein
MFFGISLADARGPSFGRRCLSVSSARRVGNRFRTLPRSKACSTNWSAHLNAPDRISSWSFAPNSYHRSAGRRSLVGRSRVAGQTGGCATAPNRPASSRQPRPSAPAQKMRWSDCRVNAPSTVVLGARAAWYDADVIRVGTMVHTAGLLAVRRDDKIDRCESCRK